MSLRALWKGVFVVENQRIPLRLYAAATDHNVHFRLLHADDLAPVQQRMTETDSDKEVPREEMQKGAEVEKGTFVALQEDELDELEPEPSREIELRQIVPRFSLPHMWYDRPYFLAPDGNKQAYFALLRYFQNEEKEAIVRWVMRKKEYVGSLHAYRGCVVLVTLRFADQVVEPDEIDVSLDDELNPKEVKMAKQLLGMLESDFDPAEFQDEYRDRVWSLIDRKAKGKKPPKPKRKSREESSSLRDALKKSLANAEKE